MLTIIMYHYVRDLRRSRFPAIKGLDLARFDGQLEHIASNYTVVSLADLLSAIDGAQVLPANACILSFDDGFLDHYSNVFPRLDRRGWTGCFFPPARAILEYKVLDVHKIHVVLASTDDPVKLVRRVLALLQESRKNFEIPPDEILFAQLAEAGRYDSAEIIFIKRLLQRELPEPVRQQIVEELFLEQVGDEAAFAKDLYMDQEQMQCMARAGMEFGGHGFNHIWLGAQNVERQRDEIHKTVDFLSSIQTAPVQDWTMCYPYGSYNQDTLTILDAARCRIGLTTKIGVVKSLEHPLELVRLDTNDIPCSS